MNYRQFNIDILKMAGSPKKFKNFAWGYEEGYYYITFDMCEIFRVPTCYMFLNLGLLKSENHELVKIFNDCSKWCDKDLTVKDNITTEYFRTDKWLVSMFEENIELDIKMVERFGNIEELIECCHFRGNEKNKGVSIWNESDECIGLLLGIKR